MQAVRPTILSWKNWTAVILLGVLCAGNIFSGKPFVAPNSAEGIGYDLASALLWSAFLWALWPFIRNSSHRQRPGTAPSFGATSVGERAEPQSEMQRRAKGSVFLMILSAVTFTLCVYVALAERPFSFFFNEQSIDQSIITESVVNVLCFSVDGKNMGGSGTILTTDGVVITNSHVIPQDHAQLLTTENGCLVILPNKVNGQPEDTYWARPIVISGLSDKYDLAYLRIYRTFIDDHGNSRGAFPRVFPSIFAETDKYDQICRLNGRARLGDPIRIFGYPQTSGGLDLTVTDGVISSIAPDGSILTSAKVDAGNSGGLAVDKNGCMVGVPSEVSEGKYQNLGVIIPTAHVVEFSDAVSKLKQSN